MDILHRCKINLGKVFCVCYEVFTGTKILLFNFTRKSEEFLNKLAKLQENTIFLILFCYNDQTDSHSAGTGMGANAQRKRVVVNISPVKGF